MKKTSESNSNFKKQLVSGAVYIALAVTVVAVTVSTITASFSDNGTKTPAKTPETTLYGTDYELNLPDIPRTDSADIGDFTLDTPVADVEQGVDATVTGKNDTVKESEKSDAGEDSPEKVTPSGTESGAKSGGDSGTLSGEAEVTPALPDKTKPAAEEPAEPTFEIGYDGYIKPCPGYISKEFSVDLPVYSATMYDYRTHAGIDIACEGGTPVKAVTGGVISDVYTDYMYGTTVVVEHADGVSSIYCGLSPELPVETVVGRTVLTGEVLGGIGNSALCESAEVSHLHFEMTKDGVAVDPTAYIGK